MADPVLTLSPLETRVLGTLVDDLSAARESSRTSQDPVAMVTAALGARPAHRG